MKNFMECLKMKKTLPAPMKNSKLGELSEALSIRMKRKNRLNSIQAKSL